MIQQIIKINVEYVITTVKMKKHVMCTYEIENTIPCYPSG